jgi:hypothetical protein
MNLLLALVVAMLAIGTLRAQTPRDEAVRAATDLVSAKIGVAAADLRVVSVAEATWRDSSLGCPERGQVYTPALVGGFRVTLQGGSTRYEVHTGSGRAVMCDGAAPAAKAPNEAVRPALDAAAHARRHLGSRLGIAPADLVITRIRPWRVQDGTCEPPAGVKAGGPTFFIELSRDEQRYRYRATREAAWPCADKEQGSGIRD